MSFSRGYSLVQGYIKPPIILSFGTSLSLGTSAQLFGSEDVASMVAIAGTDNVAACTNVMNSSQGVKGIDPACSQLWQWTNGGASPRYVESNSRSLAAYGGNVYWGGRLASGVPGLGCIDPSDGSSVFPVVNIYSQSGNQINVTNNAICANEDQLWCLLRDTFPQMTHVQFDLSDGSEVRREYALSSTATFSFTFTNGLLITSDTSGSIISAWDPDTDSVIWSINCNSSDVSTPSTIATGMNIQPSLDGSIVYVTRGGSYGSNTSPILMALDAATGAELWAVDLSSVEYCNASCGIYNGGVTIDKYGDIYVLCRVGSSGRVVRMTPDGGKVYISTDQGVSIAAGSGQYTTCLAVSEQSGIVYVGDTNGKIHTVIQA